MTQGRRDRGGKKSQRPGQPRICVRSAAMQLRGLDVKKRTATFTAATETLVDMGWGLRESLRMSGIDLTRFDKNPVLLDSHNMWESGAVIGEAPATVEGKLLVAEARYAETDRAEEIWKLVRDGFLRTVSIGYDVRKHIELAEGAEDGEVRGPAIIATDWELFEISNVPIPADEDAVRRSYYQARGLGDLHGRRLRNGKRTMIDWGKVDRARRPGKGATTMSKGKKKKTGKRAHDDDHKDDEEKRGALADLLVEQVDGAVTDDKPREDVIQMLADALDWETADVEAALAGEIALDGDALKSIAAVLPVTLAQLEEAQAADSEDDDAETDDDDAEVDEEVDADAEAAAAPGSRSKKKKAEIEAETQAREIRAMAPRGLEAEADELVLQGVSVKRARKILQKAHADARKPIGTDEPGTVKTKTKDKGKAKDDAGATKIDSADSFLAGFTG